MRIFSQRARVDKSSARISRFSYDRSTQAEISNAAAQRTGLNFIIEVGRRIVARRAASRLVSRSCAGARFPDEKVSVRIEDGFEGRQNFDVHGFSSTAAWRVQPRCHIEEKRDGLLPFFVTSACVTGARSCRATHAFSTETTNGIVDLNMHRSLGPSAR